MIVRGLIVRATSLSCLMVEHVLQELGNRIRKRRKSLDWSQEALALAAGIDRSYLGGVERGERNVTFTVLCRIAAALKCDVAALTHYLPD
jgi:transcriptional regulator with XRE-family HTH domain